MGAGPQLLSAENDTEAAQLSLAQALPSLRQAIGLSLPCRELCDAILAHCDCRPVHSYELGKLVVAPWPPGSMLDILMSESVDYVLSPPPVSGQLLMHGGTRIKHLCWLPGPKAIASLW